MANWSFASGWAFVASSCWNWITFRTWRKLTWWQTAWNLWTAAHVDSDSRFLAVGALAAFVGLSAFCMFNEGFYQRQLWLVMALADRLRLLADEPRPHEAGVGLNLRAQAVG